jgi:NAD(P)-dependent dehydrogenase (short-subunit alcohol dehydrogenase family)
VVIMTGRSQTKVNSARDEIQHEVRNDALAVAELDITDETSIDECAKLVQEKYGRLDVLINNAGIAPDGPELGKTYRSTLITNVVGPALVSAAFRPLLLKSTNPCSIYISSSTGSLGLITDPTSYMRGTFAGSPAYRASKAALNMTVLHEQLEVAGTHLKIFAICPGLVVSNLRGTSKEAREAGGRAGDPSESAELVLKILRGERDADSTSLIYKDGVHPW